jgi:hypothetical protein
MKEPLFSTEYLNEKFAFTYLNGTPEQFIQLCKNIGIVYPLGSCAQKYTVVNIHAKDMYKHGRTWDRIMFFWYCGSCTFMVIAICTFMNTCYTHARAYKCLQAHMQPRIFINVNTGRISPFFRLT